MRMLNDGPRFELLAQNTTPEQQKAASNKATGTQGFDTKAQDKGSVKASTGTAHVDIQKLNNDQKARDKETAKKAHLDDKHPPVDKQ